MSDNHKNFLTPPQNFALCKSLERDKERLETVGGVHENLAADYARELDFSISVSNLRSALRAVGVKTKRSGYRRGGKDADRIALLELKMERMQAYFHAQGIPGFEEDDFHADSDEPLAPED